MLLKAYTIYDSKSLQYHSPWFASTDGAATRSMADLVNDQNTSLGRHPRDYSLWHVGTWDDNKGQFYPQTPPLHIVDGIALVSGNEQGALFPVPGNPEFERVLNGKGK